MARRANRTGFTIEDVGAVPPTTPESAAEAHARNGEYRGPATVRHLPPGVCGADLSATRKEQIKPGQIWRRGDQRVRITSVMGNDVRFLELLPPRGQRRVPRVQFLRTSHREVE